MKKSICMLLIAATLTGCGEMTKEDTGTLTGAVVGGLIGSRFGHGSGRAAAVVGGTVVGAYIGNRIGAHMDKVDRMEMDRALEEMPDGRTKRWTNPNTGYRYEVEPTRTYYQNDPSGYKQPCREYRTNAWIDGKRQQVRGVACRGDDGNWRVQ